MIDLTPLVQIALGLLSTALLIAGRWVIPAAVSWFTSTTKLNKVVEDTEIRNYFLSALDRAIALGVEEMNNKQITIDTGNALAKFAFDYLTTLVPAALQNFGLTEEGVTLLVKARLAELGFTDPDAPAA